MTKKLIALAFVLAAASIPKPAAALTCPRGFHVQVCGDISFCCRNGTVCDC